MSVNPSQTLEGTNLFVCLQTERLAVLGFGVIPYVHRTQLCTSRNYESLAYSRMFALINVGGGLFNFDKICLQRKQDDVYKSVSNDERSNLFCVCLLLGKRRYQGTNCGKQSDCLDQTVYYNLST